MAFFFWWYLYPILGQAKPSNSVAPRSGGKGAITRGGKGTGGGKGPRRLNDSFSPSPHSVLRTQYPVTLPPGFPLLALSQPFIDCQTDNVAIAGGWVAQKPVFCNFRLCRFCSVSSTYAFAPKGHDSIAQGNALGTGPTPQTIQGPTGRNNGPRNANAARQRVTVRWTLKFLHGPPSRGLRPGLSSWAPSGLRAAAAAPGHCPAPLSERLGRRPVRRRGRWNKTDLDVSARLCADIARFCAAQPGANGPRNVLSIPNDADIDYLTRSRRVPKRRKRGHHWGRKRDRGGKRPPA